MAPRLRVAVVSRAVMPLHGLGGLERSVHDLVQHLAARDVSVTLITPPARSGAASPFDPARVSLRSVPYVTFPFANRRGTTVLDRSSAYPIFGLRAGRAALSLARSGAVDIVHGFGASVLGYALSRADVQAPLVVNPQGLEEFGATAVALPRLKHAGYWPLRRAVRVVTHAADAIIATDRALEPAIARHLQPRPGQVRWIPNGIDPTVADALAGADEGRWMRARHGLDADAPVLLSVGRLEQNKGFDDVVAALARLASAAGHPLGSRWKWVLVGTGPFARDIDAAVASHGLADRVIATGQVSDRDLHAWYEAATLFVHPTRYEGSSLVTLEAMAHRRAVVATRAGGLPDKVRPGRNGWLVDPGDVAELAAAVGDALADPARLRAMGQAGRAIVEQEFSWSVLVDRQLALYDELLRVPRIH
jgi:glycogen(starch) synthase